MREIKFRAWDGKEKKMITDMQESKLILIPTTPDWAVASSNPVIGDNIFDDYVYSWSDADVIDGRWIPMQYTGLKDKNGKEIYEGDILKGIFTPEPPASFHGNFPKSYGILVEVIFDDVSFLFKNLWKGKLSRAWERKRLTDNRIDEIEIIGNIYENPELVGK
jgi:uncharacterized phage protein (TIGR01671 family)